MRFFVVALVPVLLSIAMTAHGARADAATKTKTAETPGYRVSQTIKLGGGDERWDYATFDADEHRLFLSRQTHVDVVDVASGKIVGTIPDTDGVHGIALAPDLHRGFASNGKAQTVTAFDLKTLARVSDVKSGGENPDAIIYDKATKLVFVMNGRGKSVSAIDGNSLKVKATVDIGGKPEFAVVDGGQLFVNLEDKGEMVVIDTAKLAIATRFSLTGCEEPGALAVDRSTHRLFVGCGNKLLAVVDEKTGKIVQTLPSGDHTDAAAFDAKTNEVFLSNGDGTLTVAHEISADTYSLEGNAPTEHGARTMALDEATGTVYLPTADFGEPPAATAAQSRPRPPVKAGTFRVLVATRAPQLKR